MNEQLIKSTSSEFPPYVEFKDLPDTTTPVDATNLNALQSLMRQDIQDNQSIPIGGVTGQVLGKASNTDYDVEWIYQAGTNYDSLPVGAILPYGSLTPPTGYLVCDGSAVSRTEYANLFSVIGTSFGEGDGTTTFNLPNIDGRGIVGFSSSDDDFNTIGKTGGSKTHTQTVEELAKHGHSRSVAHGAGVQAVTIASGNTTDARDVADFDAIKDTGESQPMDIMNPYIVACYIIKAYGTAILTGNIVDSLDGNSTTLAPSQNAVNTAINDIKSDKSFIVGYLSSSQDILNANNIRVNINASTTEGDYFQLDSENHQITVLKDCMAILSGGMFVDGSEGDGYVWGRISINGTNKTSHLERIINRDYTNVSIPTTAVKLRQNDTITLELDYSSTIGNPSLRSGNSITFVSVAKL